MFPVSVRLTAPEREAIDRLARCLATPLMPTVTTADVLRAGLRALAAQVTTSGAES